MESKLYLDGKALEHDLPLRSLFYGEGLFETFRWNHEPPVALNRHIKRLKKGSEVLDIPFPGREKVEEYTRKAVKNFECEEAYVKICLIASGSLKYHDRPGGSSLLTIVRDYEHPKEYVTAHVSSFRYDSSSPTIRVKSTNYLKNVLAQREAANEGYDEGIFLNERDEVCEGSSANIFWLRGKTLLTPSPECGLLPGITRGLLMSVGPKIGLEVREGRFELGSLLDSDGVFLTNSLAGIKVVLGIDGEKIGWNERIYENIRSTLFEELGWKKSGEKSN